MPQCWSSTMSSFAFVPGQVVSALQGCQGMGQFAYAVRFRTVKSQCYHCIERTWVQVGREEFIPFWSVNL